MVVTAGEKREVKPHHLRLVQQLQPLNTKSEKYYSKKQKEEEEEVPKPVCKYMFVFKTFVYVGQLRSAGW